MCFFLLVVVTVFFVVKHKIAPLAVQRSLGAVTRRHVVFVVRRLQELGGTRTSWASQGAAR